jgi:transposase
LERWRANVLANGSGAGSSQRWTAAARLQAVIITAAMDEATRSAWCREQGLYPAELEAWKRDAIAGLGEPRAASAVEARHDRRRVKELERELHRKDKALAETAALLVLSKKLMWTAPKWQALRHFAEAPHSISRPGAPDRTNRRRHVSQLLGLWPRSSPVAAKRGVEDAGLEVGHKPRDHQDGRLVLSGGP